MAYSSISIYNGFSNQSKNMGGKMARGVGLGRHPIGGLGVL